MTAATRADWALLNSPHRCGRAPGSSLGSADFYDRFFPARHFGSQIRSVDSLRMQWAQNAARRTKAGKQIPVAEPQICSAAAAAAPCQGKYHPSTSTCGLATDETLADVPQHIRPRMNSFLVDAELQVFEMCRKLISGRSFELDPGQRCSVFRPSRFCPVPGGFEACP